MLRAVVLAVVVGLAGGCAHGAYSGLTIIPTADMLGAGEACVDYQVYTPTSVGSGVEAAYVNTQFGVGSRGEVGVDFDLTAGAETGAVFNGKVALRPMEAGLGIAAGMYNAGERLRPTSYVAATLPAGERLRLHFGVHRTPEESQGFAGADYSVSERVCVYGEHLAGDENASAATVAYQLTGKWYLSVAWQRPNDEQADDCLVFDIGCLHPME